MFCEEHSEPLALRLKGDVTVAPLAGAATTTLVVEVAETTLTATSATHDAPWFPQDLTWSTWFPGIAVT